MRWILSGEVKSQTPVLTDVTHDSICSNSPITIQPITEKYTAEVSLVTLLEFRRVIDLIIHRTRRYPSITSMRDDPELCNQ